MAAAFLVAMQVTERVTCGGDATVRLGIPGR